MIQRIQSVWYLLAIGGMVAMLFLPTWINVGGESIGITSLMPFTIAVAIISASLLAAIFAFKKRPAQIKLGSFAVIISFILLVAILLPVFIDIFPSLSTPKPTVGSFLPVATIIFTVLGNVFVRKDEKLVKSMDRLR